jgi:hypothetical protein
MKLLDLKGFAFDGVQGAKPIALFLSPAIRFSASC